jgi:hypothetical protein
MAWQIAPPLIIIMGAFSIIGLGIEAIDKLAYGKVGILIVLINGNLIAISFRNGDF